MDQNSLFLSLEEKKELEIVKKDNRLIEAKYRLSIHEQRLILAVLGQIRTDDTDTDFYKINIKEIAELHGLQNSKDLYAQIHNAGEQLLGKTLDISKGNKTIKVNWLNYIEYREGEGSLIVDFHKSLKPYLLQLKANFTQYQLSAVVNFKSAYSIRFYEFLKMRQNQGKGGQFFIRYSIFDLRDILEIAPHEYSNTKDFRVRVIEPALKEINVQSDLAIINVQYVKQGRAINEIIIYAEPKKQRAIPIPKQPEDTPVEKEIHPVIEALMSFGFSFELSKSLKAKHGIKKIERNIAYALAKKQAGEVKNMPAYLSKAIEGDWGNALEIEKEQEREKIAKIQLEEKQKKKQEEELRIKNTIKNDAIIEDFYLLPSEKRYELMQDFLICVGDSMKKSCEAKFKEFGDEAPKKSKPFRSLFLDFLKN